MEQGGSIRDSKFNPVWIVQGNEKITDLEELDEMAEVEEDGVIQKSADSQRGAVICAQFLITAEQHGIYL